MYVGQLEFFNAQTPDGLKSFGSALCMTSISLGNYVSSLLVSIVMKISTEDHMPGWIPGNLNKGHLDRFFFLLAALTTVDLVVYIGSAKWYKCIKLEGNLKRQMRKMTLKFDVRSAVPSLYKQERGMGVATSTCIKTSRLKICGVRETCFLPTKSLITFTSSCFYYTKLNVVFISML